MGESRLAWVGGVFSRPHGWYGVIVTGTVLLAAGVSLFWTPHPLLESDPAHGWEGPSATHLLGTDQIGRDTFSWLLAGAQATVFVVVVATLLAALVGLSLGALGGAIRPRFAEPLVVLIDILVAFPVVLIAMLLAATVGGSLWVVAVSVGVGAGVNLARVTRAEIVKANGADYVLAARAAGTGPIARLWWHVLPNITPVVVVQLSVTAGIAVLAEAGLTFLGFGAEVSQASWGRVLAEAQKYIAVAPASVIWPGLAIGLTVLALNLLGDAIAEALDPRLARRGARRGA